MTQVLAMKVGVGILFALLFAWLTWAGRGRERWRLEGEENLPAYVPGLDVSLPWVYLAEIAVFSVLNLGKERGAVLLVSMLFQIMVSMTLYYALLLLILPALRKTISPRTCAILWILPHYLLLIQYGFLQAERPIWKIPVSEQLLRVLLAVWACGFVLSMVWQVASHFWFRRKILRNAVPEWDPIAKAALEEELQRANLPSAWKLRELRSPQVSSPLSIGLLARSLRIVLPQREYTEEEYRLIFRHELVHIGHRDIWSKFLLATWTAACWFNPLSWIARKESSEDLELFCDETVLLKEEMPVRRRYAELLLETAGNSMGYTTCLSGAKSTMRVRLRAAVEAKLQSRPSGAPLVALLFFLLSMSCGLVGVVWGEQTAAEALFPSGTDTAQLTEVRVKGGTYRMETDFLDENSLEDYLLSLTVMETPTQYLLDEEEPTVSFYYSTKDGLKHITFTDQYLQVHTIDRAGNKVYWLPEPVDWERLQQMAPELPKASIVLNSGGSVIEAEVSVLVQRAGGDSGEDRVLIRREGQPERGLIGSHAWTEGEITFSLPLCSGLTMTAATWDGTQQCSLDPQEGEEGIWTFSLPYPSAYYTIQGTFLGTDGKEYQTEFRFEAGLMEDAYAREPAP